MTRAEALPACSRVNPASTPASARKPAAVGACYAELLHDISEASRGSGCASLQISVPPRPPVAAAARDARVRDGIEQLLYGVRPGEATPLRPAYTVGGGAMTQLRHVRRPTAEPSDWRLIAASPGYAGRTSWR